MSREPTALLLAAFLITFALTRAYTRIGCDAVAVFFGVGAAIYATSIGRGRGTDRLTRSVDGTVMEVVLASLLLIGLSPFGVHDGGRIPWLAAFVVGR